jgi:hypothetical protein
LAVFEALGSPASKAVIYDLEQEVRKEVAETLLTEVLDGNRTLDDLLTDYFLRDMHR